MTKFLSKLKLLYNYLCLCFDNLCSWLTEKYDALTAWLSRISQRGYGKLHALKESLCRWVDKAEKACNSVRTKPNLSQKLRKWYSVFIALVPIVMFINVPVLNMGVSTIVLVFIAVFVLLSVFLKIGFNKCIRYIPWGLAALYLLCKVVGNISHTILLLVAAVHIFVVTCNSVNIRIVRRVIEVVSMVAALCVLIQTVAYYLFDYNLMYLQPWFILAEQHKQLGHLSIYGTTYRPSAFFMEPSHYAQYCCLGILSVLFPMNGKKANLPKAFWIIMGCILTTSGMGILLCVIVFGWYILFSPRPRETRAKFLLQWFIAAMVAFVILMQFDIFSIAVSRIFGYVDGYNAILGRLNSWTPYLNMLTPLEELIGVGMRDMPSGYMTGLLEIVFCYGYIGAVVVLCVLVRIYRKHRDPFTRCVCLLWGVLLMIANLIDFMSLTFWFAIILTTKQENAGDSAVQNLS